MGALLLALFVWLGVAHADDLPPIDQHDLDVWWKAAGQLWMDDTAYKADGTTFDGGVCRYKFDEGVIIPVFSGKKPVSERRVGLVFIGKGSMEMSFPDAGDAQAFANHMVLHGDKTAAEMAAIAHGTAPYTAPIENGFILSANPDVQKALFDLSPIGAGVMIKEAQDGAGIDEYYTVTENRGKTRARLVATNLIPQRRRLLQLSGVDPLAMLRQDRFLYEEFAVPKEDLRFIADFRTSDHYRVAEPLAGGVLAGDHDRWLTCYRDPQGFLDSGYDTMVFAHGQDREGVRHFRRLDGKRLEADVDGRLAHPAFEPVDAVTTIEAHPKGITANYIDVSVTSELTVRAVGQDRQALAMALPNWSAVPKTFELVSLKLADGTDVAWSGIYADLPYAGGITKNTGGSRGNDNAELTGGEESATTTGGSTAIATTPTLDTSGAEGPSAAEFDDSMGGNRPAQVPTGSAQLQLLNQYTARERYEIIAVLPKRIAPGESVTLTVKWKARWPYANWAGVNATTDSLTDSSTFVAKPTGTTTGAQAFLPRLLPSTGLGEWNAKTTVGVPGLGLRSFDVAVTGDTMEEWQSDDGWKWVRAQTRMARTPMVAIGGWKSLYDPRAMGLPAVSVHLFGSQQHALPEFAPEVRRVLAFLDRFLPSYPFAEVDVYQGASGDDANSYWGSGGTDLIGIRTFLKMGTGQSEAERENEYIAQTLLARQLAGQYWGQAIQPASARDVWVTEGLADAYALFYIRAAIKDKGYDAFTERLAAIRKNFESAVERSSETGGQQKGQSRQVAWSLTGSTTMTDVPWKLLDDYRTYFWAQMLRVRIGDDVFFPTLDALAQRAMGHWVSSAEVLATFEQASGQDLDAYFDQWVHGGLIPKVEAWTERRPDGSFVGCIHSDIPFGHIEMPVKVGEPYEIKGGGEGKDVGLMNPAEALVDIVDGWGTFRVPKAAKNSVAILDPDAYLMTVGRKVHTEWNPECPAVE